MSKDSKAKKTKKHYKSLEKKTARRSMFTARRS